MSSPLAGPLWETLVLVEIRRAPSNREGGWELSFWRDRSREADFLRHRESRRAAAAGHTRHALAVGADLSYSRTMADDNLLLFPEGAAAELGDVWQVARVLMPSWVDEGGTPYRPVGALAVSRHHELIGASDDLAKEGPAHRQAEQALASLAKLLGHRPAVIEVSDPALAERLRQRRRWRECEVRVCDDLLDLRAVYRAMREGLNQDDPRPPLLSGPGITVDRVRRFAEAALRFWNAEPWSLFAATDMIELEPPAGAPDLRVCLVMGQGGDQFGILLGASPAAFTFSEEDPDHPAPHETLWSVSFDEAPELPVANHDLWLEHDLPATPDGLIPCTRGFTPTPQEVLVPDAARLAVLEGLLDAFATVSEEAADSGSWSAEVETESGRLVLRFGLPEIDDGFLENLAADFELEDDEDEEPAQTLPRPCDNVELLVDLSLATEGRLSARLAARALELDSRHPMAHFAAGAAAADPEHRLAGIARAVQEMERVLGKRALARHRGRVVELDGGRTLLRLRRVLAIELCRSGHFEEALACDRELLALDEMDRIGARHLLPAHLMAADRDAEAEEWLARPEHEEPSAEWHYLRALSSFRLERPGDAANRVLAAAFACNPSVPPLLIGLAPLPDSEPEVFRPGGPDEAAIFVMHYAWLWSTTPDALEWLGERFARHLARQARSRLAGATKAKRTRRR
jgi:tetratricopeptide (TPR) repeat protein